ncbi:iron ABC transporter substrate-binding protein [Methylopila jiangsuensis]|uniref:Iron ABC transporter substrate-binding protein n=1 Tax=Methylopila jiangsuensis TaxID=586230 RepID=A0A9W6JC47_9HYPH|nr:iron ABC transporter substrate-binding protein [Methylopila jiangsuensis]MDR6287250.1 iron complex transport system substrate-binding protein [Methylopila jiangsuensis]GLK74791.1 iron ABC transporter substrate-binding protein [Methylopila jiangsuensis]
MAPVARALALVTALLAAACPAAAKVFTDAAGRRVEIPDAPKRVLPAGPPAAVLVYVVAPDLLAGWTRAPSADEKPFLRPEVRDLPAYGRLAGRGGTANLEAVLAAKPDLIVDVGSVDKTYAALADRVQAQTGVPYILIDGALAKSPETLRRLGLALNRETRAGELATYADDALTSVAAGVARIPTEARPRVYYARGPDGLETAPKGSITVESLDAVGAVNVAEGGTGLARVSPEQILGWNPDAVVTIDQRFATRAKSDPVWSGIKAVREGRVYAAPAAPFGWLDAPPAVNRLIGLRWLARALYGGAFPGDLRAETKRFYALFYGVALDDARLDDLLPAAGPPR